MPRHSLVGGVCGAAGARHSLGGGACGAASTQYSTRHAWTPVHLGMVATVNVRIVVAR